MGFPLELPLAFALDVSILSGLHPMAGRWSLPTMDNGALKIKYGRAR
jgi:hypothetical protein